MKGLPLKSNQKEASQLKRDSKKYFDAVGQDGMLGKMYVWNTKDASTLRQYTVVGMEAM